MKDTKELIKNYLQEMRVMQLATSVGNKPWVCNVHFCNDDQLNFYWISTPARRHSEEIKQNAYAAVTMKIHEDTPEEKYVIGLSAEGTASLLDEKEVRKIGKKYIQKLVKDPQLLEDIISGKNPHRFYKLTVSNFVLFDSKNFPDNPRQECKP